MRFSLLLCIMAIHLLVFSQVKEKIDYDQRFRPQFHFTPAINWMNDPNGLVYYKGKYHLFFQFNPFGNKWGHMSWGHSESKDLMHWSPLPVAIPEKDSVMIFSGSCVPDITNSSGFGKAGVPPLVAVYTAHITPDASKPDDVRQSQYIAYSLDEGITWQQYAHNPVLDLHKKDFRDPKVFWYAPGRKWVMAVVLPQDHVVQFYGSKNLKQWEHLSDFGPQGSIEHIWECPDLFQVPVEGHPEQKKWVLFNSQETTVQYFVGEFNGNNFTNENPQGRVYRQDYGPDYYAVVTYNNLKSYMKPVSVGWANNWKYATEIPTYPWKSTMALPRELSLKRVNNEWILLQKPASGFTTLRKPAYEWHGTFEKTKILPVKGQILEIEANLKVPQGSIAGFHLAVGENNQFVIGYNSVTKSLFIDRSKASDTAFSKVFTSMSKYEAPLMLTKGELQLHIFFDKSIIEIFVNDGKVVLTAQLFTNERNNGIELFNSVGTMKVNKLSIWPLKSTWK